MTDSERAYFEPILAALPRSADGMPLYPGRMIARECCNGEWITEALTKVGSEWVETATYGFRASECFASEAMVKKSKG